MLAESGSQPHVLLRVTEVLEPLVFCFVVEEVFFVFVPIERGSSTGILDSRCFIELVVVDSSSALALHGVMFGHRRCGAA
eukprot:5166997-Amphidinium_carterae.1